MWQATFERRAGCALAAEAESDSLWKSDCTQGQECLSSPLSRCRRRSSAPLRGANFTQNYCSGLPRSNPYSRACSTVSPIILITSVKSLFLFLRKPNEWQWEQRLGLQKQQVRNAKGRGFVSKKEWLRSRTPVVAGICRWCRGVAACQAVYRVTRAHTPTHINDNSFKIELTQCQIVKSHLILDCKIQNKPPSMFMTLISDLNPVLLGCH